MRKSAQAMALRIADQRVDQLSAHALAESVLANADHFQAQARQRAAEFSAGTARQDVACQAAAVRCGQLHVQRGLRQGGTQPALEIVAARAALCGRVDGDDRVKVL